jgi:hypothetical protein
MTCSGLIYCSFDGLLVTPRTPRSTPGVTRRASCAYRLHEDADGAEARAVQRPRRDLGDRGDASDAPVFLQRSRTDHPEFPDSLIVFGADSEGLSMNYFDSRGVHRIYQVSLGDGVWRMWRHAPGFSQKFNGSTSADGNTIEGLWKLSRDDSTWADDLAITFRRK